MKTKYNNIIENIIALMLIVPLLTLLGLKYVFKAIATIVNAISVTIEVSIKYIRELFKVVVKELSVKY